MIQIVKAWTVVREFQTGKLLRSITIVSALAAVAACATTVAVSGRFPARYPAAAELRKVAVAHFSGNGGNEFTSAMEAALFSADFDGARHFSIVGSGRSPFSQDAGAQASFGRSVGAQGVLFGQTDIITQNDRYQGTRSVCVTWENNKCVRYVNEPVPCIRRTVTLVASPKLVKTAGGATAYSADKRQTTTISWCGGQAQPTPDEALLAKLRAQIVTDIRRDIAPYNATLDASLKTDPKGLAEAQQPQFELALKAATAGNMAGACEIWRNIDAASPNHLGTAYNLGVCAEAEGDYAGALDRYRRVQTLAPADRAIIGSIARATTLANASGALAAQQAQRDRDAAAAAARDRAAAEAQRRDAAAAAQKAQQAAASARAAQAVRRNQVVKQYGEAAAPQILAGKVTTGMTAAQVRAAKGAPGKIDRIPGGVERWHYGSQRIVLTNGKVTAVTN